MSRLQDDMEFLNSLRYELESIINEFKKYLNSLSEAQLNWQSNAQKWTISQQLTHIKLHNDTFLKLSFKETDRAIERGLHSPDKPFRSCAMGSLYTGIISPSSSFKFRSIDKFVPTNKPLKSVLKDELIPSTHQILHLIDLVENQKVDMNKVTFLVPGSQHYKFPIGDVIKIMLVHSKRHLHQIKEITDHPDFPKEN